MRAIPPSVVALALALLAGGGCRADSTALAPLPAGDHGFLSDLQHRSFLFFWHETDPATGLV